MICSSVKRFFTSNLLESRNWTPDRRATQNRGDVGWTSAGFAADAATATNEGRGVIPAPQIAVDRDRRTITATLPAEAMDFPTDLTGAKVYVTTWDYDGGYRALQPEAGGSRFGGGEASGTKVLDAADLVITREEIRKVALRSPSHTTIRSNGEQLRPPQNKVGFR